MRTFNHETIIVDEIIAAKKTFKQHQNDGKAIRDIQTIIEDTKIDIDNIQEVLSNNKLIQQVWLRIRNADTSIGDEILGTKEQGNNGSHYRPYLTLDGKNIIEIRIADHYETKKTCLDKSNNKVQYLFQVVLITEPPKPESDASIKTNQSVGNVKVLTNDIVSQDTELDIVVTLFQKISNFFNAPSETYNEIVNNNQLNCNKHMNKNTIRLSELQLHSIIKRIFTETVKYGPDQLPEILKDMAEYARQCMANDEDVYGYFDEITQTGLFHDACGKVDFFNNPYRICRTDY